MSIYLDYFSTNLKYIYLHIFVPSNIILYHKIYQTNFLLCIYFFLSFDIICGVVIVIFIKLFFYRTILQVMVEKGSMLMYNLLLFVDNELANYFIIFKQI